MANKKATKKKNNVGAMNHAPKNGTVKKQPKKKK